MNRGIKTTDTTESMIELWIRLESKVETFNVGPYGNIKKGIPEVIIVDETELKTTQGTFYLWFTLVPYEKTLLRFAIIQEDVIS